MSDDVNVCLLDEWDPVNQEDSDSDRLTGLEDFGILLRPLGLSEKKPVPEPIPFTEHDPLGALVSGAGSGGENLLYRGSLSFRFNNIAIQQYNNIVQNIAYACPVFVLSIY